MENQENVQSQDINQSINKEHTVITSETNAEMKDFPFSTRVSNELVVNINGEAIDLRNPTIRQQKTISFMMALGGFFGEEQQDLAQRQYESFIKLKQDRELAELERIDEQNLETLAEMQGESEEINKHLEDLGIIEKQETETSTGFVGWLKKITNL